MKFLAVILGGAIMLAGLIGGCATAPEASRARSLVSFVPPLGGLSAGVAGMTLIASSGALP